MTLEDLREILTCARLVWRLMRHLADTSLARRPDGWTLRVRVSRTSELTLRLDRR